MCTVGLNLLYVYIFGAVCPARDTGAAIIMPAVNVAAMNEHLAEISRCVAPAAHALDKSGFVRSVTGFSGLPGFKPS